MEISKTKEEKEMERRIVVKFKHYVPGLLDEPRKRKPGEMKKLMVVVSLDDDGYNVSGIWIDPGIKKTYLMNIKDQEYLLKQEEFINQLEREMGCPQKENKTE